MKAVSFSTCTELHCSVGATVIICLTDPALLETPQNTIEGTIVSITPTCGNYCRYVLSYDEDLLADPDTLLTTEEISNIFCKDACFPKWIQDLIGDVEDLIVTDTNSINLTISAGQPQTLSADAKVSATSGNILSIESDGLYVPDGGGLAIGTINSQSKSANGAVMASGDLILQTAEAGFPGLVSTGAQSFAGAKTFLTAPILDSLTASLPLKLDGSKGITAAAIALGGSEVTGTLLVPNGGTGFATLAQGDLIYGSAVNTFSKLTKDANATRYLSNTGTSNNPAWAQVNLANGVTGTLPVGNGGTGITAVGTANQLFGVNSGATANEYKTLSVGTSGTDFAIAHAANSVTFNLPDASAANRGLITTGSQTIAGSKTFTGAVTRIDGDLYLSLAVGRILAGATSVTFRNNADNADNLIISNAGLVTARAGFVATTGNVALTAGDLVFSAASARILPGTTSLIFRNNADNADNLIISNAGVVTIRAGLTVTSGDIAASSGQVTWNVGGRAGVLSSSGGNSTVIIGSTTNNPLELRVNNTEVVRFATGKVIMSMAGGNETTGAGSAALGSNSPAVTNTAPYTWFKVTTSDGSAGFIPVWK